MTGCALGVVAISFSLVYATTKIFHVAHAGIYTLGGYLAWSAGHARRADAGRAAARGGGLHRRRRADPAVLYARLERRHATHLVMLIASLGTLAVMQNIIAAVYTPEHPAIPAALGEPTSVALGGVRLTWAQLLTVAVSLRPMPA